MPVTVWGRKLDKPESRLRLNWHTWNYIAGRCKLTTTEAAGLIGHSPAFFRELIIKNKVINIHAAQALCHLVALRGHDLEKLIDEAEETINHYQVAALLGIGRNQAKNLIKRSGVTALTHRPKVYIFKRDLVQVMSPEYKFIADMFRRNPLYIFRTRRSWTSHGLADRLGLDAITIDRWETGQVVPNPDLYFRIGLVCGKQVLKDLLLWCEEFYRDVLNKEIKDARAYLFNHPEMQ